MFVFVSGASSSGKSEWAEHKALELSGPGSNIPGRIYLATAHVSKSDSDMQRRVARHRERRRDREFCTIERERDLADLITLNGGQTAFIPCGSLVLLECLPNWLANEMFAPKTNTPSIAPLDNLDNAALLEKITGTIRALREHTRHLIVVSDDLFSDGVSYDPMTQNYIELLGALHVRLVAMADMAVECVSGLARFWKVVARAHYLINRTT